MATDQQLDKKQISDEEQELMDKLELPKHVQDALIKIVISERHFERSTIRSIKDVINKSCVDRATLYYKYGI